MKNHYSENRVNENHVSGGHIFTRAKVLDRIYIIVNKDIAAVTISSN